MKALSAAALAAIDSNGAAPIYLLQIDFAVPAALTIRLSDQPVTAMGYDWSPLVADWGTLEAALNTQNVDGRPATAEIALTNLYPVASAARITDLIRSANNNGDGAYEFAYAKATVYQMSDGLTAVGDAIRLGVFYLEDPNDMGEHRLTLRMSDQSLVLEDALQVTRISRTAFPSCAQATVGTSIRRPMGTLKNVPAIPVVDGAIGALSGAHTDVQTTITLVDAADFATGQAIMVDTELITLGTKSGNAFTGSTRAANGTTATAHSDGAAVFLIRSGTNAYRFVVGEHDGAFTIKSVSNILVNGRPAVTSPTTTLDATDIATGKHFAAINFTPPDIGEFHTLPLGRIKIISVSALTVTGDGVSNVASATRTIPVGSNSEASGITTRKLTWRMTRSSGVWAVGNHFNISRSGAGANITGNGDGVTSEYNGTDVLTYSGNQDESIFFTALLGSGVVATLTFVAYEVSWAPIGGRSTSTAARCIGEVTCDVEGIRDDGGGTISGTPSLLLENPADISKFILKQLYGVTDFGTTWAATRASLVAAGYKWAFALDYTTFSQLRRKLGEQARSALYLEEGRWEYEYLPNSPAGQLTLDYTRDVWEQNPARISRSARIDIKNSLKVSSQRDYVQENYRYFKLHEDLTQLGRAQASDLVLDLVQDVTTANALGSFWLTQWSRQVFVVDLTTWWNALAIEQIDYLQIANHPVLERHGGASLVFRVVARSYLVGSENPGRIRLLLVEVVPVGEDPPFGRKLNNPGLTRAWDDAARATQRRKALALYSDDPPFGKDPYNPGLRAWESGDAPQQRRKMLVQ